MRSRYYHPEWKHGAPWWTVCWADLVGDFYWLAYDLGFLDVSEYQPFRDGRWRLDVWNVHRERRALVDACLARMRP